MHTYCLNVSKQMVRQRRPVAPEVVKWRTQSGGGWQTGQACRGRRDGCLECDAKTHMPRARASEGLARISLESFKPLVQRCFSEVEENFVGLYISVSEVANTNREFHRRLQITIIIHWMFFDSVFLLIGKYLMCHFKTASSQKSQSADFDS